MHIATRQEVIDGQVVTIKILPPGYAAYGWAPQGPVSVPASDVCKPVKNHPSKARNEAMAKTARANWQAIVVLRKLGVGVKALCQRACAGQETVRSAIRWGIETGQLEAPK